MASSAIRLLVTGGTGLLGGAVLRAARARPEVVPLATFHHARPDPALASWIPFDLRDPIAARQAILSARPDIVLHAAVAMAPGDLLTVIVEGSGHVAAAAREAGARLVHVSSDMVFDGASGPYGEDASPSPITPYGRAKARAEERVRAASPGATIVRCSLLYRLDPPDRSLGAWLDGPGGATAYPLFTDEIRCPAQVDDVAAALVELALRREALPVLHAVGPVAISRYEFGKRVLAALGRDPQEAVAARSQDSGLPRPRELVLTTRGTPGWFTAGLRAPEDALGAR
jgi:dTDP-4-dehydrorhamnose reductase